MKRISFILLLFISFVSCNDNIVTENTPLNVFNAFWKTLDERYVYFEEKKVNWDSVYFINIERVKNTKTDDELADVLQETINLFEDQHLGIVINSVTHIGYSPLDTIGYFYFPIYNYGFEPFPFFSGKNDLSTIYKHKTKKYIYIEYSSFRSKSDLQILKDEIKNLNYSEGVILDIRNNNGGFSNYAMDLSALFFSGERVAFIEEPKNGTKKNEFRQKTIIKNRGNNLIPSSIPIILLTSKRVYSAGNLFAYMMADLPNCIVVGDKTGGGGSPIKSVYLPNGWILYYPNTKNYSSTGLNMEYGLDPDYLIPHKAFNDTVQFLKSIELLDSINGYN